MGKSVISLLIIFIFFSDQLFSQSSIDRFDPFHNNIFPTARPLGETMKMDSIIATSFSGSALKSTFLYDPNDKMTEWLVSYRSGTMWDESAKEVYLYDSSSILITEFSLGWSMTSWDTLYRQDYYYQNGKLARFIFQNFTENGWMYSDRSTYKYNTSGDIKSILHEEYLNNEWEYKTLMTYFYSCSNMSILFQNWVNNNWQDAINTDFFYNEQGDLDSAVARQWDGTYWVNYMKLEVTNDQNHNQIQKIEKIWENSDWQNSYKFDFIFNELHYIESAHCNVWNGYQWVEGNGDILLVNPDGFKAGFGSNDVAVYYEHPSRIDASSEIRNPDYALFPNYPNPFNPTTTIKYRIPILGFVELKIYDVLGREVAVLVNEYKTSGAYEVRFDAGNLSSGVYFYSLRSGGFTATGKMIVQK